MALTLAESEQVFLYTPCKVGLSVTRLVKRFFIEARHEFCDKRVIVRDIVCKLKLGEEYRHVSGIVALRACGTLAAFAKAVGTAHGLCTLFIFKGAKDGKHKRGIIV